jgi:D-arabinose 1-dehydrogenase-like Zn-dependent alcohol dehydrogenase
MRALRVEKNDGEITTELRELDDDDLMAGDVTIDVEYSSINFKDGLAIMGRPGVIRDYPHHPGHRPRWHGRDGGCRQPMVSGRPRAAQRLGCG